MSKETKFGYGFLLAGVGVPFLIFEIFGFKPAVIAASICTVVGFALLIAGHRHTEERKQRGVMSTIGLYLFIGALIGASAGALAGIALVLKQKFHPEPQVAADKLRDVSGAASVQQNQRASATAEQTKSSDSSNPPPVTGHPHGARAAPPPSPDEKLIADALVLAQKIRDLYDDYQERSDKLFDKKVAAINLTTDTKTQEMVNQDFNINHRFLEQEIGRTWAKYQADAINLRDRIKDKLQPGTRDRSRDGLYEIRFNAAIVLGDIATDLESAAKRLKEQIKQP